MLHPLTRSKLYPKKLCAGAHVRVIAPARSLALISPAVRAIASERFAHLGLKLSFGRSVEVCDGALSSSIDLRVQDLHEAFQDTSVDAIFTVIGGYNSNELLPFLNYDLIQANPKIFCGFSDITALSNAIFARTGLVTYSGPHYSSLGMLQGIEYTLHALQAALFSNAPYQVEASREWSNDLWFLDQEQRTFHPNAGIKVLREGQATGDIVGGNLGTLALLHGTPFMPRLNGAILFIEAEEGVPLHLFNRQLHALSQQPGFAQIAALVIGRFTPSSKITDEAIRESIDSIDALNNIPIVCNIDFGHTTPLMTFPIGGVATINNDQITILEH